VSLFRCLALFVLALAGAAGLALAGAAPAGAADEEVGGSPAYSCDYKPGGLCTCDGGHNTDSCEKLKRSGLCGDESGVVVMCCEGSKCTCRIGGQEGTQCPVGQEPAIAPPGAVKRAPSPGGAVQKQVAPPAPKPGYIWVNDHWERERKKK
jgi:hypothetical protein